MERFLYEFDFDEIRKCENKNFVLNSPFFVEAFERIRFWFDKYAGQIKKIVEIEGITTDNISELVQMDIFLANVVAMCEGGYVFDREIVGSLRDIDHWIHDINIDLVHCYLSNMPGSENISYRKIINDIYKKSESCHKSA